MIKKCTVLWCCLYLCIEIIGGQLEGEHCFTFTSQPGVCTHIGNCQSILIGLRQGNDNYNLCGYRGHVRIVCCPSEIATTESITTTEPEIRISAKKCREYAEYAFDIVLIRNMLGFPPVEIKKANCAFTVVPLIVGGDQAKPREFPHMALIGYSIDDTIQWGCGGSLISEQFVLSAAHCIDTLKGLAKYVRLGEHDLDRIDDASHIDLNIIESIPHPEYRDPKRYNDIGLFKLERRIQFNYAIRPACLPEESAVTKDRAIATGWGSVDWGAKQSNVLLKVILGIFSEQECNSTYRIDRKLNRGIVGGIQVCAGSKDDKKDTCQGDSGGPLQIYHANHFCTYTVVGVTSFGNVCGIKELPGVYTRVYTYVNWIESIVWPNE